jgi:hypothetical protein
MHSLKVITTAVQRLPVFETFPSAVSNYIWSVAPFIYLEPQRSESSCYSTAVPCDAVVRQRMPDREGALWRNWLRVSLQCSTDLADKLLRIPSQLVPRSHAARSNGTSSFRSSQLSCATVRAKRLFAESAFLF